jgi:hypothetical protein
MGRKDMKRFRPGGVPGFGLALALLLWGCGGEDRDGDPESRAPAESEAWEGDVEEATRVLRPQEGTERDWQILREKLTEFWALGLDTIPLGDAVARIGASFVGTPYAPGTLELAGPEAVVVNLEEMDCVTLVENSLALARFLRRAEPGILEADLRTRELYRDLLRQMRYRRGRVEGYPSRLHYFSDWIRDNQARGLVKEVTRELGGVEDLRAIDYMSTHPEAYRQLANPANLAAIRDAETRLSLQVRYRIPQEEIATWTAWIRNGDIIAVTSNVEGLDVAHTGLAFWKDDHLHLLHAPLVGEAVEVSDLPLAERIVRLESQDGIRVVRPLPDRDPGSRD